MKSFRNCLYSSMFALALVPAARAQPDPGMHHVEVSPRMLDVHPGEENDEKEKVAFLGVETAPAGRTLANQLGLPRETGLVVTHVLDKSPAAEVIKEDDVLTKLDDQILINMEQLGVLVRSRKEGDEVRLTVVRAGKEMTVQAKLGAHEVPKRGDAFFFPHGGGMHGFMGRDELPGFEREGGLPGMGPGEARDVLHMIGRERGNFIAGPDVHVLRHQGKGSTILDLPKSNITYSDDDGAIEIKADDLARNLTVKDAKGVVLFSGPVTTEDERRKLPP